MYSRIITHANREGHPFRVRLHIRSNVPQRKEEFLQSEKFAVRNTTGNSFPFLFYCILLKGKMTYRRYFLLLLYPETRKDQTINCKMLLQSKSGNDTSNCLYSWLLIITENGMQAYEYVHVCKYRLYIKFDLC